MNTNNFKFLIILLLSIFCFLMSQCCITMQKINYFEYNILILFALLGIFFYMLLKWFNHSVFIYWITKFVFLPYGCYKKDAGLKYFILGAFSSSLFLFGSSILYRVSSTTNFKDLKNVFSTLRLDCVSTQMLGINTFVKYIFLDGSLIQFALVFLFVSLLFKLAIALFHLNNQFKNNV